MKKRMFTNVTILTIAYVGGILNAFAGGRSVNMSTWQLILFVFGRVVLYAFVGLIFVTLRDIRDHKK